MAINEYGQGGGGGGGTALTVKESGGAAIEDVSTIKFDDGSSGFGVTDEGSGVVEITLGSHWKDLEVDGQTTLTPSGEEDLEIEAGTNITITTDASSTPKKLTITASGGGGGGSGDVVGPGSATDDRIATFDGTTGKLLQDGGTAISGLAAASHNHAASAITSGVLDFDRGGTNSATRQAAINSLTGSGTNTHVLTLTGGNAGWAAGGGGGGGGSWGDDPEDATLDGVVALEKQDTVPSASADFAKIYSKEVSVSGTSTGHILLRGNTGSSVTTNSGSLGTDCTISQIGSGTAIAADSFTDAYGETTGCLKFSTSGYRYMKITPGVHPLELDGEFCIDMWWHPNGENDRSFFFAWNSTNSDTAISDGNGSNLLLGAKFNGTSLAYNYSGYSNLNAWVHLALSRDSTNLVRFFINGTSVGSATNTTTSTPHSTYGITLFRSGGGGSTDMAGYIDDFRILFGSTGGMEGSSFDLPTIGHGLSTGSQTHMFAMDSAGNEYQLTKAYMPV